MRFLLLRWCYLVSSWNKIDQYNSLMLWHTEKIHQWAWPLSHTTVSSGFKFWQNLCVIPQWPRCQHRNTKIREMREDFPGQCQFVNFPRLIKKRDWPSTSTWSVHCLGVSRGSWPLEISLCRKVLRCHQVQVNLCPGLCSKLPASVTRSPLFFWSVITSYPMP